MVVRATPSARDSRAGAVRRASRNAGPWLCSIEVADLVHDDVVEDVVGRKDEPPVERERPVRRARPPAAALVAERDPAVRRRRARRPPISAISETRGAASRRPCASVRRSRSRPSRGTGARASCRSSHGRCSVSAASISASLARGRTTSSGGRPGRTTIRVPRTRFDRRISSSTMQPPTSTRRIPRLSPPGRLTRRRTSQRASLDADLELPPRAA